MAEKWMQRAFGAHPGALHKAMGVPKGQKLPLAKLRAWRKRLQGKSKKGTLSAKQGKMLRRINLAMRVQTGDLK